MNRTTLAMFALGGVAAVFTCGYGLGVATRTLAGLARLAAMAAAILAGAVAIWRYFPRQG